MAILLLETLRLSGSLARHDGVTRRCSSSQSKPSLFMIDIRNSKKCDARKSKTRKTRMNNQEPNSRNMEKSTRSFGRRNGPYGYAFNTLSKIWLALAVGFLLIPGVA